MKGAHDHIPTSVGARMRDNEHNNPEGQRTMSDNVIEVCSIGDGQIVLGLASDREHAVPMLSITDTYESRWLIELSGAELIRVFAQIENLLTADEDEIHEWVDQLRNPEARKALQEGIVMQFKSNQPGRPDEPLVSLAELAIELTNGDIDGLARQISADAIQLDDIGRRCVSRSTARRLFTERAERKAKEAERRAEWAERYRELDARMKAQLRGGIPATPGGSALADLMSGDQR